VDQQRNQRQIGAEGTDGAQERAYGSAGAEPVRAATPEGRGCTTRPLQGATPEEEAAGAGRGATTGADVRAGGTGSASALPASAATVRHALSRPWPTGSAAAPGDRATDVGSQFSIPASADRAAPTDRETLPFGAPHPSTQPPAVPQHGARSLSQRLRAPGAAPLLALLLAVALSLLVYGRAMDLALVNDDVAHVLALRHGPLGEILRAQGGTGGGAYFRPLSHLLLWTTQRLWGPTAPPLYALCLTLHALNLWLLWLLARRLGGALYASAAALAWGLFPTHYEAVAYVAALMHPLSTLCILLGLLALDRALRQGGGWWIATGGLILLAPLAHEQGIVLPALMLGWQLLTARPRSLRRWLHTPLPWLTLLALPLLALRARSGAGLTDAISPSLANSARALQQVGQLLAYPLAWFTGGLPEGALAALGALLATLTATLLPRRAPRRGALAGLGWLLITAAPLVLLVEAAQLPSSPRLFYLPSVGVALLYAHLPALLCDPALPPRPAPRSRAALQAALAALWVALLCIGPLPAIRCALDALEQGSAVVCATVSAAGNLQPGQRSTLVNLPFFHVRPCHGPAGLSPAWPLRAVGVVILPRYASAAQLVDLNGGPQAEIQTAYYPGFAPDWSVHGDEISALALRERIERGESVLAVDLHGGRVLDLSAALQRDSAAPQDAAWLEPLRDPPERLASERAGEVPRAPRHPRAPLCDLQLPEAVLPGEELPLRLYWCPEDAQGLSGLRLALRLRDRYGNLLLEQRLEALPGYEPSLWRPGDVFVTSRGLAVPANAALGTALLELAVLGGPEEWAPVAEVLIGQARTLAALPAEATPLEARWENGIRLAGWQLQAGPEPDTLLVTLYWRAEQPPAEDLTVFLHLAGAEGPPLAQVDGEPADGQYPTSRWATEQVVVDARTLVLPEGVERSQLRLLVGWYRWPSLERLRVTVSGAPEGAPAPAGDSLTLLEPGELR
jgi:hypothetical protein